MKTNENARGGMRERKVFSAPEKSLTLNKWEKESSGRYFNFSSFFSPWTMEARKHSNFSFFSFFLLFLRENANLIVSSSFARENSNQARRAFIPETSYSFFPYSAVFLGLNAAAADFPQDRNRPKEKAKRVSLGKKTANRWIFLYRKSIIICGKSGVLLL